MSVELNPSQLKAATNSSPDFAVIASAGAGKTRVLVERYLHHVVDEGLTPDQILTITFTRKAAAEMKKRIVERLQELGRPEDAQTAETGPISTIHGFCERLLRENALAAQVDPKFDVAQSPYTDLLYAEAVREVLASELATSPLVDRLLTRLSGKSAYRTGPVLEEVLKNYLVATVESFRTSGIGYDRLSEIYESPASLSTYALNTFAETNLALKLLLDQGHSGVEALDRLKRLKPKDRGDATEWLIGKFDPTLESDSFQESWAIANLALEVWRLYESRLYSLQSLDFNLLEQKAVSLVRNNDNVRLRLRHQYRAMLVDETQDVNPIQFALIDALKLEKSMLVGDPQQSIYHFRGAEPKLFAERADKDGSVVLTKNYRSRPYIIAFVNDFFQTLWPDRYSAMEPKEEAHKRDPKYSGVELWPTPSFDSAFTAHQVHQMVEEGTPPGSIAILVERAAKAVDLSDALTTLGVPSQIYGGSRRFYVRMETRDLANALSACADPTDTYALTALLLSPYVGLDLDSIVLIGHTSPLLERIQNTPLPEPEQEERRLRFLDWFPGLVQVADRVPAWELVSELFHQTDYFHQVVSRPGGRQTLANARKLLTLAVDQPHLKAREYADLIRQIPDFNHRESEAVTFDSDHGAVSIMTIHTAKGLEFDTVVLPDLFSRIGFHMSDTPYLHRPTGLVSLAHPRGRPTLANWIAKKESQAETEEKLRLLYVAMTRAQKRLCIAVPEPATYSLSLGNVIVQTLNYPDVLHPSIQVKRPAPPDPPFPPQDLPPPPAVD